MFLASLLALTLTGGVPQSASVAAPQIAPGEARCELHIWPAARLESLPFAVGMIKGRASREQIDGAMGELLSPASQTGAVRDANPLGELRLPADTRIIEHSEPLDPKTVGKIKTRRAQSTSPCYAELIIVRHDLIEDIVWGDRFLSTFLFRDFGDKPEARLSIKGEGGNKLKVLTLSAQARPADAPQLVAGAVRANFLEFTKNARPRIAAPR